MTGLETLLDEAVKRGLVGFTIFQTQDGRWQANMTFDRLGWQHKFGADPIEAAIALLAPPAIPQNANPEDIFG
jgi:hypothetical protein